jgi:hypothetical protein
LMGEIVSFHEHRASDTDQAWERYRALAQATLDNPRLSVDRQHSQATIRAWERFRRAYLATGQP